MRIPASSLDQIVLNTHENSLSGHTSHMSQTEDSALEDGQTADDCAGASGPDTSMAEATGDETDRSKKGGHENINKSKSKGGDDGMVDVCRICGEYWRPRRAKALSKTAQGKVRDEASVHKSRQREYELLRNSMHSVRTLLRMCTHTIKR